MTIMPSKEIRALWRNAAAAITLVMALNPIGAPHVAAQYFPLPYDPNDKLHQVNPNARPAPETPKQAAPPPQSLKKQPTLQEAIAAAKATKPEDRFYTKCLNPEQLSSMVGTPLQTDRLGDLNLLPPILGRKVTAMQQENVTLAREINSVRQLYVQYADGSARFYFGVNTDAEAKDSAHKIRLFGDTTQGKAQAGDFSIAGTILNNQLKEYPIWLLQDDTKLVVENRKLLQHIRDNNFVTAAGTIDINKLAPNLQGQAKILQNFMAGRNWAIVRNQPEIALLPPNTINQPTLVPAGYQNGAYAFYGIQGLPPNTDPETTFGELYAQAAQNNDPSRISTSRQLMSMAQNATVDLSGASATPAPIAPPTAPLSAAPFGGTGATTPQDETLHQVLPKSGVPQSAPVTPVAPSAQPPAALSSSQQTSPLPLPILTNDDKNNIRKARTNAIAATGSQWNKVMNLFKDPEYTGPVADGKNLILPPISDAEAQKFLACYMEPSCYTPKNGEQIRHKDWGFRKPSEPQAAPRPQSFNPNITPSGPVRPNALASHSDPATAAQLAKIRALRAQSVAVINQSKGQSHHTP